MWALRRRLVYSVLLFLALATPVFYSTFHFFYQAPTCTDGVQNGEEAGVDCGGSCSLLCSSDILPIETVWAHFFRNDNGSYDIAVLFLNKNSGSAPKSLKVTVLVKAKNGDVLYQNALDTAVPLGAEFPVIFQNVTMKGAPDKIVVVREEDNSYALTNKVMNPVKSVATFNKSSNNSVFVTVTNVTKKDLYRFPVMVVLYDENHEPVGVAESFVESLFKGDTKTIEVVLGKVFEREPFSLRAYTALDPYAF
jgi:hypothetical protein